MNIYRNFGKRLFDLILSFTGIIISAPVYLAVPILIRIDSHGAVFFRQKRMGRGGKVFLLYKFRSMAADPDGEKKGFEPGSAMRVTRVGRILRKTKIDEIPQLFNVLLGDMSFVGPRPEVERYRAFYTGDFAAVLSVRPGITDMASIKYRHEENILSASTDPESTYKTQILPDKLQIALAYVHDGVSFFNDMKIMVLTVLSVVSKH
ncbi:MAG: sugar transferase [Candidatus Omnitrophota bacterium]